MSNKYVGLKKLNDIINKYKRKWLRPLAIRLELT